MVDYLAKHLRILAQKGRLWVVLYFLMLPTIAGMIVFDYYPKIDVIVMSFFRWEPPTVMEYIGLGNFMDAAADPLFWQSFQLILILLVTNLLKMWPAIFAAVALHRVANQTHRYIYQVLFVVPMVVPGLVWLLIWKSFYDPDFGILNRFLNATGMMTLLTWMDGTHDAPGVMPRISEALQPVFGMVINPLFGGIWSFLFFGAILATLASRGAPHESRGGAVGWMLALPAVWTFAFVTGLGSTFGGFLVTFGVSIFILYKLAVITGGFWVLWFIWIAGLCAVSFHKPIYITALPLVAVAVVEVLYRRLEYFTARESARWTAWMLLTAASFLVVFGMIWTHPTGQFIEGSPAWLGNTDLVIPAIIFWGFPWVGTIGVLIYLSGLQQISQDVYEAAELDGVGPIGMLFRIELPLMMTQVRINLIFMTIGTLTTYEFFLLLLGPDGGPGNKGMVPGLYMYKRAFEDGHFGYACALGMVLFFIVLGLTIIYNKYVRVEK
ncbi:MAG: hypothetical protein JJU00_08815 [Opitutales bacterium]|nr:hypothetical protein [Opitutales bacterium]